MDTEPKNIRHRAAHIAKGSPGWPAHLVVNQTRENLVSSTLDMARAMIRNNGFVYPTAIVFNAEGRAMCLGLMPPYNNEAVKDFSDYIRISSREINAIRLVHVMEAYSVDAGEDSTQEERNELKKQDLKNMPGSKEVVNVLYEDQFKCWCHSSELICNEDGKASDISMEVIVSEGFEDVGGFHHNLLGRELA